MSNSALSGCGTFLCPVCDHGLYEKPIGWRFVGWIFSRFADQNQPLTFFGSKSLRPSQPVVENNLLVLWSRLGESSFLSSSYHWNRRDDPMSRCTAHPSLGSTWRWDCSPLASQSKWRPCSTRGRDYGLRASRRACWRVRALHRCRSSCDLCSWIVWHLWDEEKISRWDRVETNSSCNQRVLKDEAAASLMQSDNVDRL